MICCYRAIASLFWKYLCFVGYCGFVCAYVSACFCCLKGSLGFEEFWLILGVAELIFFLVCTIGWISLWRGEIGCLCLMFGGFGLFCVFYGVMCDFRVVWMCVAAVMLVCYSCMLFGCFVFVCVVLLVLCCSS